MAKWKEYFYNEEQMIEVLEKTFESESVHSIAINRRTFLKNMYKYYKKNGELTPKQITQIKRRAIKLAQIGWLVLDFNRESREVTPKSKRN